MNQTCLVSLLALLTLSAGHASALESAAAGRDPTVPAALWQKTQQAAATGAARDNSKTGQVVVLGPARRLVVLDGNLVKAGDTLNGAKVVAVTASKVVLDDDSRSIELSPSVHRAKPDRTTKQKGPVVLPVVANASKSTGDTNAKQ